MSQRNLSITKVTQTIRSGIEKIADFIVSDDYHLLSDEEKKLYKLKYPITRRLSSAVSTLGKTSDLLAFLSTGLTGLIGFSSQITELAILTSVSSVLIPYLLPVAITTILLSTLIFVTTLALRLINRHQILHLKSSRDQIKKIRLTYLTDDFDPRLDQSEAMDQPYVIDQKDKLIETLSRQSDLLAKKLTKIENEPHANKEQRSEAISRTLDFYQQSIKFINKIDQFSDVDIQKTMIHLILQPDESATVNTALSKLPTPVDKHNKESALRIFFNTMTPDEINNTTCENLVDLYLKRQQRYFRFANRISYKLFTMPHKHREFLSEDEISTLMHGQTQTPESTTKPSQKMRPLQPPKPSTRPKTTHDYQRHTSSIFGPKPPHKPKTSSKGTQTK